NAHRTDHSPGEQVVGVVGDAHRREAIGPHEHDCRPHATGLGDGDLSFVEILGMVGSDVGPILHTLATFGAGPRAYFLAHARRSSGPGGEGAIASQERWERERQDSDRDRRGTHYG